MSRVLIAGAELICFFPVGSFYASRLACLLPRSTGHAVAEAGCPPRRRPRGAVLRRAVAAGGLAFAVLALAGRAALAAETETEGPPAFFDALVSISPGLSRELGLAFDHLRAPEGRLTQLSVRLQYPVLSWLQLSLEVPIIFLEPEASSPSTGAGDIVLLGQAVVWAPRGWPAELDAGLELTLPTGASSVLAGSTAVRPFAAAGTKLGPLDVLGNLSYQWFTAGPSAGTELFQASVAVGYPTRWIAPFAELTLVKPVRGPADLRPQIAVVPGIELFLPWNLSLSVGVQLPLGPARTIDQRVLAFLKWSF